MTTETNQPSEATVAPTDAATSQEPTPTTLEPTAAIDAEQSRPSPSLFSNSIDPAVLAKQEEYLKKRREALESEVKAVELDPSSLPPYRVTRTASGQLRIYKSAPLNRPGEDIIEIRRIEGDLSALKQALVADFSVDPKKAYINQITKGIKIRVRCSFLSPLLRGRPCS
jgi:hypothetical protein